VTAGTLGAASALLALWLPAAGSAAIVLPIATGIGTVPLRRSGSASCPCRL
jgi:hypothetical protein